MAYIGEYRTRSGCSYFRWSFERQNNGEIHAYILSAPGYRSRPAGGHVTHRYEDESGNRYVCYEPMPRKLSHAIAIAKKWAECTENYIYSGKEF